MKPENYEGSYATRVTEDLASSKITQTPYEQPLRTSTEKLYLVVRSDLSPGQQAVQLAHASHEFGDAFPEEYRDWRSKSNTLALLSTGNEATLSALLEKARARGVPVASFHEPDRDGELTAIALGPSGKRFCRGLRCALG